MYLMSAAGGLRALTTVQLLALAALRTCLAMAARPQLGDLPSSKDAVLPDDLVRAPCSD